MSKLVNYIDEKLMIKLGDHERKELKDIVINYYKLKHLETGIDELELLAMLFEEDECLVDIAANVGLSTRQLRRRRDKYIDFFIKIIHIHINSINKNEKRT